jgi:hypothetical protein
MKKYLFILALVVVSSCGTRYFDMSLSLDLPDTTVKSIQVALVSFDPVKNFNKYFDSKNFKATINLAGTGEDNKAKEDTFLSVSWNKQLNNLHEGMVWPLENHKIINPVVSEGYLIFKKKHWWILSKTFNYGGQVCCYAYGMEVKDNAHLICNLDHVKMIRLKDIVK